MASYRERDGEHVLSGREGDFALDERVAAVGGNVGAVLLAAEGEGDVVSRDGDGLVACKAASLACGQGKTHL